VSPTPKIALAHDFLVHIRGGEKVLLALQEVYPDAPIYALVADKRKVREVQSLDVRESFMSRAPLVRRFFRAYLPFYPLAAESLDFSGYDLVLSTSSLFVKNILTSPSTCHICYCHTPNRYLWGQEMYEGREEKSLRDRLLSPLLARMRAWDEKCSDRVDYFVANSGTTAERISRFYHRAAEVIHPPVDIETFRPTAEHEGFFLCVAHLVPYKRIDLAIQAFASLGKRLVVVGRGPERTRLQRLAGPDVQFLGAVPRETLHRLYETCRALVVPTFEDFGIVTVEAQACGKPVIAYRAGGSTEIVIENETGVFFDEQSAASLADAVVRFEKQRFDPAVVRANVERFDKKIFQHRMRELVDARLSEFQRGVNPRHHKGEHK
jgi:glycosyltransferase involved in cell wall biosynthesis